MSLSILDNNTLNHQVLLDDNYEIIDTPAGFKNIILRPHQQTIIKALLDIEQQRVVLVDNKDKSIILTTTAVVLSEPFGSGKTIEILGWILSRPVPRAVPYSANSIFIYNRHARRSSWALDAPCNGAVYHTEIIRRYTGPNVLIRSNLIIVGSSVLTQWETTIKTYTNLKALVVGNYYQILKFQQLYNERKLRQYDIVLLKNGNVSGHFNIPNDIFGDKEVRSTINVISSITASSCWSRVIYDDFDTIKIPAHSYAINALFTGYVSATTKIDYEVNPMVVYDNIIDALRKRQIPLNYVISDKLLFTNFNVRNHITFTEKSTSIPIIEKYKYVYNNPDDNYIRLLGAMGAEDANNIMEMLNGDAISTAAETMGIKTDNVADIFKRMLDKKYDSYLRDKKVLNVIESIKDMIGSLPENPKEYKMIELDNISKSIMQAISPRLEYRSPVLVELINKLYDETKLSLDANGKSIHRVIDNIKERQCQICCLPLEDLDAFIIRCCGLIVCDICGIKGNNITKKYDHRRTGYTISGSCANCKSDIDPRTDLLFLDHTFNVEKLLDVSYDELLPQDVIEHKPKKTINVKIQALLDIINGIVPDMRTPSINYIPQLLTGTVNIPRPANLDSKILVFASHNETLNNIETVLGEQGINFLRLGGTYQEMAATVAQFAGSGKILLINSQQNCAGLNLQFCTDLVFFHKLMNVHVEAQVAGRAQRIGRTCNLQMHYLYYNNETFL